MEIAVRPRKGFKAVCSRCHRPAPGCGQLAERRFEFVPFWGFLVFLLYSMRRVDCRRCQAVVVEEVPWGDGKRTLTKAYMLFLARWARRFIREHCSQALHVLDRFHIVANMNKAPDNVRAEETSRMKREGRAPVLRKSRWLLFELALYHSLGKPPEPDSTHDFFYNQHLLRPCSRFSAI